MYHIEFSDHSNPYIGFDEGSLDKWKVDFLLTEIEPGFYQARPAAGKVYRSKIKRSRDRYGCYHYEYDLGTKTLHFESYDKLGSLDALQELYRSYPELLLEPVK